MWLIWYVCINDTGWWDGGRFPSPVHRAVTGRGFKAPRQERGENWEGTFLKQGREWSPHKKPTLFPSLNLIQIYCLSANWRTQCSRSTKLSIYIWHTYLNIRITFNRNSILNVKITGLSNLFSNLCHLLHIWSESKNRVIKELNKTFLHQNCYNKNIKI